MNARPTKSTCVVAASALRGLLRRARLPWRFGVFVGLAVAAAAAGAQTTVTLYGGARGGGQFDDASGNGNHYKLDNGAAASASVDWQLDDGRVGQLFYSFQRSGLPGQAFGLPANVPVDISYLQLGGRAFFDGDAKSGGGYVVGGLGATFFMPSGAGLTNEVRASANAGVGWQWAVARNVALRTELRGYLTLINASGGFLCSGGCVVSIRGNTLTQAEAMVGVSVGF